MVRLLSTTRAHRVYAFSSPPRSFCEVPADVAPPASPPPRRSPPSNWRTQLASPKIARYSNLRHLDLRPVSPPPARTRAELDVRGIRIPATDVPARRVDDRAHDDRDDADRRDPRHSVPPPSLLRRRRRRLAWGQRSPSPVAARPDRTPTPSRNSKFANSSSRYLSTLGGGDPSNMTDPGRGPTPNPRRRSSARRRCQRERPRLPTLRVRGRPGVQRSTRRRRVLAHERLRLGRFVPEFANQPRAVVKQRTRRKTARISGATLSHPRAPPQSFVSPSLGVTHTGAHPASATCAAPSSRDRSLARLKGRPLSKMFNFRRTSRSRMRVAMRYPTSAATTTGPILALAEHQPRRDVLPRPRGDVRVARGDCTSHRPGLVDRHAPRSRRKNRHPPRTRAAVRRGLLGGPAPAPQVRGDAVARDEQRREFRPHASSPRFTTRVGESGASRGRRRSRRWCGSTRQPPRRREAGQRLVHPTHRRLHLRRVWAVSVPGVVGLFEVERHERRRRSTRVWIGFGNRVSHPLTDDVDPSLERRLRVVREEDVRASVFDHGSLPGQSRSSRIRARGGDPDGLALAPHSVPVSLIVNSEPSFGSHMLATMPWCSSCSPVTME